MLLSLPFLNVFVQGVIMGSFETFTTQDSIAQARPFYILISALILFADVIVCNGLIKSIRSK